MSRQPIFKILLAMLLLAGFVHAADYTGFKRLSKGEWATTLLSTDEGEMEQTMIYVGEGTSGGKKVYGVEHRVTIPQMGTTVTQIWYDAKSHEPLTIVSKEGQGVTCFSASMGGMMGEPQPSMTTTPSEFSPKRPKLRFDTYKTPTGKKVRVAVFKTDNGEVWVSSQVPFGLVKAVADGRTQLRLKDFGKGKKASIPVKEALACQPMDLGNMLKGFGGF